MFLHFESNTRVHFPKPNAAGQLVLELRFKMSLSLQKYDAMANDTVQSELKGEKVQEVERSCSVDDL